MHEGGDPKHFGQPNTLSKRDPVSNMHNLGDTKCASFLSPFLYGFSWTQPDGQMVWNCREPKTR